MKKYNVRLFAGLLAVLLLLGSVSVAAAPEGEKPKDGTGIKLTVPTQIGVDEWTDPASVDKYEPVATDNGATLFADMTSGKFALRNDKTGHIWYSVPNDRLTDMTTVGLRANELDSNIVVGYVNVAGETRVASISYVGSNECVSAGTVKVTKVDKGIRVVYDFESIGFRVPVEYTLEEGTLVTSVKLKEILTADAFIEQKLKEGWPEEYAEMLLPSYLMSVWVNPGFGAQNTEQTGYVFVPDGSGALVDFKPGFSAPNTLYEKPLYGEEKAQTIQVLDSYEQNIHMPVFGTVVEDDALCGIIEVGDELSTILSIGSSADCGYTGVSCRISLRDLYSSFLYQGTSNEREVKRVSTNKVTYDEYRVRYTMLTGKKASYVGMADLYRDYLVEEKGLTKRETAASLNVDLLACAETDANFLGFTYKKKLAMTTYDQAAEIIKALQEAGVDNVSTRLMGWTNNGLVNRSPSVKAQPLSKLGGKNDFLSLAEVAAAAGSFYPNQDMLNYTKSGSGVSARQDCAKTAFGMPAYQYKYMYSVLVYNTKFDPSRLLAPNALQSVADQFKANYSKLGVKNLSLNTLTNYCYSDFDKDGMYRDEMVKLMTGILADYADSFALEGEAAHAYTFPYLTRVLDVPLDSSQYDFFDKDVPFYSLVLHGYMGLAGGHMNRSYDTRQSLLKSVETGSELRYMGMYMDSADLKDTESNDYYSTTYTLWLEDAAAYWKEYSPLLKKIQNSTIVGHESLTKDVVRTTYDNGIAVYVNYGEKAYTAKDGTKVDARNFTYVGGDQ